MIKQLFKQIWTERRQNAWLLIELTAVFLFLLLMADFLWVRLKNYMEPKGFDIENTYVLKLKTLDAISPDYVKPEDNTETSVDELLSLVERVKLYPDVEYASVSIFSSPYSMGGVWNPLQVDTLWTDGLRFRYVTPSYFDVFRIRSADGKPIQVEETGYKQMIVTENLAKYFFGDAYNTIGKEIKAYNGPSDESTRRVTAVCNLIKRQEFLPYEMAYFEVLSAVELSRWVETNDITWLDVCLRIKQGSRKHFEENFLSDMGARLRENNLYIASVESSDKLRDDVVGKIIREDIMLMAYVMAFVLITVFMGVFGAFWLRTRQRRSDIGVRMAMGANQRDIWLSVAAESLCLISLTVVPAFLIYVNLLNADILDTGRLPFTFGRTMIALGAALFIIIVIVIGGVTWPANRAASIQPVDALRDE